MTAIPTSTALIERLNGAADYFDEPGEPSTASIADLPLLLRRAAVAIAAQDAKLAAVRQALKGYCEHRFACAVHPARLHRFGATYASTAKCDCGLAAALATDAQEATASRQEPT